MRIFRLQLSKAHTAVLAVMVLLSIAAAGAVAALVPPSYSTTAQLVVIGPTTGTDGRPSNPFLNFTPALNVTADVLVLSSLRESTVRSVVAQGGASGYQVADATISAEPIIKITGNARTPEQAILTTKLVLKSIEADLASRQSSAAVKKDLKVSLVTLVEPAKPAREWKKSIEYGAVALVVGLVVSFVTIVLLDRRRRKKTANHSDGQDDATSATKGDEESGEEPPPSRPTPRSRPQVLRLEDRDHPNPRPTNGTKNRNGSASHPEWSILEMAKLPHDND